MIQLSFKQVTGRSKMDCDETRRRRDSHRREDILELARVGCCFYFVYFERQCVAAEES